MKVYRRVINEKTGVEGPQHDPYGYREMSITTNEDTFIYHEGLANFIKHNGIVYAREGDFTISELYKLFEQLTGITPSKLGKLVDKINHPTKCPRCHSRKIEWVDGYPGETIQFCLQCNEPTGGYIFNESAII